MNKTHWKKTFNKDYLGAHDLEENKDIKVVIDYVVVKGIKDPQGNSSNCNVAYFKDKTKPMILNVTACKQIKKFSGSNYIEDWKNIPIQIYVREVKAFGEVVEALRIREQQPQTEKEKLNPNSDKWPKVVDRLKDKGIDGLTIAQKYYDITPENIEVLKNAAGLS